MGDEHIQPYSILIIFFALAYVCVALDGTGVLAFIALKVVQSGFSLCLSLSSTFFLLFLFPFLLFFIIISRSLTSILQGASCMYCSSLVVCLLFARDLRDLRPMFTLSIH